MIITRTLKKERNKQRASSAFREYEVKTTYLGYGSVLKTYGSGKNKCSLKFTHGRLVTKKVEPYEASK